MLHFAAHAGPRRMLLATANAALMEASPHDRFWGRGVASGASHLGLLLMRLRAELAVAGPGGRPALRRTWSLGRLAAWTAPHGLLLALRQCAVRGER